VKFSGSARGGDKLDRSASPPSGICSKRHHDVGDGVTHAQQVGQCRVDMNFTRSRHGLFPFFEFCLFRPIFDTVFLELLHFQ